MRHTWKPTTSRRARSSPRSATRSSWIRRFSRDLGHDTERLLATAAHLGWKLAEATIERAVGLSSGGDGARLDPFHDGVDEAAGLSADEFALNVAEVGDEISALRIRERTQLYVSLMILLLGCVLGGLLSRRVYRSVTAPLKALEEAAAHLGRDDLITSDRRARRRRARESRQRVQCDGREAADEPRRAPAPRPPRFADRPCRTERCSSSSWSMRSLVPVGRERPSPSCTWTSTGSRP